MSAHLLFPTIEKDQPWQASHLSGRISLLLIAWPSRESWVPPKKFWKLLLYIALYKYQNMGKKEKLKRTNLCSLNTELSSTIFSSSSMSSLGRSAVMNAFTVTDTSSGSWVSDSAVCTTYQQKTMSSYSWQLAYLFPSATHNVQDNWQELPGQSMAFCKDCFPAAHWPTVQGPCDAPNSVRGS